MALPITPNEARILAEKYGMTTVVVAGVNFASAGCFETQFVVWLRTGPTAAYTEEVGRN